MKILITGGAGFIGSSLIRNLLKNTNHNILNVDVLTYAGNLDSLASVANEPNYKFVKANICDYELMTNIFKCFKPNAVMNLAAESHVDRSIDNPEDFINTNIFGTYNLLRIANEFYRRIDNKENFLFHHISTDEVYGDLHGTDDLFTETTPYAPSSPYSASKASSDHLVRSWNRTYGLPTIITNCSNNYGPYHFPEKLIPQTILNAINGKKIPIYGDGMQVRDWLYVEDHTNALIRVVEEGKSGETYNIGGNNQKSNLEVVRSICDLLEELLPKKPIGIDSYHDLITFVKDRPGHDIKYAIDASKINRELNWMPVETFHTGLGKTVQWYLDNKQWWERVLSGEYRLEHLETNNE